MKNTILLIILFCSIGAKAQLKWHNADFKLAHKSNQIKDISFLDDQLGYLAGDNFALYKTQDGGENWTKMETKGINQRDSNLTQIIFVSKEIGFVRSNNQIYKTIDGGKEWKYFNFGNTNFMKIMNGTLCFYGDAGFGSLFFSRYYVANDSADFHNGFWPFYNVESLNWLGDSTLIIAKDSGIIYRSDDLGKNIYPWSDTLTKLGGHNAVSDVYFKDSLNGFIAYENSQIVTTKDGGKNWEVHTPFYDYGTSKFEKWNEKIYLVLSSARFIYSHDIVYFENDSFYIDTVMSSIGGFSFIAANSERLFVGFNFENDLFYKSNTPLHTPQLISNSFKIFPNPTNNKKVVFQLNSSTEEITVKAYDQIGRRMEVEIDKNDNELEIKFKYSGWVFLQFFMGDKKIHATKVQVN